MSVKRLSCAAAVAFAVLSIAGPGLAAPTAQPGAGAALEAPPAPATMVVDTEKVLAESKAMKGLQGQVEGQQQALQKEFAKKQEDLRSAEAELRKEQGTIANDAFQDKVHTFEKRVAEVQREAATKKQSLEGGFKASLDRVKQALVEVVSATSRPGTACQYGAAGCARF